MATIWDNGHTYQACRECEEAVGDDGDEDLCADCVRAHRAAGDFDWRLYLVKARARRAAVLPKLHPETMAQLDAIRAQHDAMHAAIHVANRRAA